MLVDLNQEEVKNITEALEAWEHDTGMLLGSLFGALLGGGRDDPTHAAVMRARKEKENKEIEVRKMKSVILRAKLARLQMEALTSSPADEPPADAR